MENYEEKRKLLFEKALSLYAKEGNLTIRQLANAANMNVSSINYYYRNKENLIKDVQLHLFEELKLIAQEIESLPFSNRQKLSLLLYQYALYFIENPGVSRFIHSIIGLENEQTASFISEAVNKENPVSTICYSIISEVTGITDTDLLFHRFLMMVSSLLPVAALGVMKDQNSYLQELYPKLIDTAEISRWIKAYTESIVQATLSSQ